MDHSAEISIVIPTYNGARKIGSLLHALDKQSLQNFEVIIVVDGSTDNTLEVLKNSNTIFQVKIITQQNKGRAGAKNRGVTEAAGDLIIFYDDDTAPDPGSVHNHYIFHSDRSRSILAGNVPEKMSNDKNDFQNYKAFLTEKWTKDFPFGPIELGEGNFFLSAANCSMRKETFLFLKGYNEDLTDAEDFDLAARAIESGVRIFFDRTNVAYHLDLVTCKKYILRQRQYKAAFRKLHVLEPLRKTSRQLNPATSPLKKVGYFLFSFKLWVELIDRNRILLIVPKYLRFKVYDWVVQSLSVVYPKVRL